MIRVLDYLIKQDCRFIPDDKGFELAGIYWREIEIVFRDSLHVAHYDLDQLALIDKSRLRAIREDCIHTVKTMRDAAVDRELAKKEGECNIKYGKYGLYTAIVAVIISFVALGLEIADRLE